MDRGVSEVVAFVLVFAVVISSVGILYVTAFQSMHSYQEGEQVQSAAQGMDALVSNLNDVQSQGGTEQRSGELTLRDGTIRTGGEGATLTVQVDGVDYTTVTTGTLTYQYGSSTIAYEGGGLFQGVDGEPDQSVVTKQPSLTCDNENEMAVVSLLILDSEADRSRQASGTHRLTLVQEEVTSEIFTGVSGVSVSVSDSPHRGGWEDALDQNGWSGGCDASTVLVRIVKATVVL